MAIFMRGSWAKCQRDVGLNSGCIKYQVGSLRPLFLFFRVAGYEFRLLNYRVSEFIKVTQWKVFSLFPSSYEQWYNLWGFTVNLL